LLEATVDLEVIALFAWAPEPNSGFYIVKSAMRLINSVSGAALCSLSQGDGKFTAIVRASVIRYIYTPPPL
jgi:hypothetical protein